MARTPRHEYKYFIPTREAPLLASRLQRVMRRDPHAGERGEYFVRSLYFDDGMNSAYHDKVSGVAEREKYRIRIYNLSEETILLERKKKRGDLIEKSAVRITRRLAEQLMAGNPRGLERASAPLLRDLYCQMRLRLLRPRVLVDYDREAFVLPVENVRVTLDKRVRSGLSDLSLFSDSVRTTPVFDPQRTVLEVKFDRYLPDYLPPILSRTPAERSAISKYTACRVWGI